MITKRTLWVSIIVSMIVGGIAGFAIDRYQSHPNDSYHGKSRFISFMTEELGLSKTQQGQLDSIVNYAHPRFRSIRQRFNADMQRQIDSTQQMIKVILTPRQREKFQVLIEKMKTGTDNR